jgi:hypothetical protein
LPDQRRAAGAAVGWEYWRSIRRSCSLELALSFWESHSRSACLHESARDFKTVDVQASVSVAVGHLQRSGWSDNPTSERVMLRPPDPLMNKRLAETAMVLALLRSIGA